LLFFGNGNGTFQSAVTYPVGSGPQELQLSDLNGDGKVDIVVINANANTLSVLRGNGNGTFQPAVTTPVRFGSFTPVTADLNNDGKPDLIIMDNALDVIDVRLNSPWTRSVAINATAGTSASNVLVATFIDYDSTKTAGSFTATINWGDSTPQTSGTVSSNGSGGFNVNGTHVYAAFGTYSVNIQIVDDSANFAGVISTATVIKADQSISFGALANKTFGDPDFSVSATASSGLPVSFAATGTCTISGSTVHIMNAGPCTITASQAGNSAYNAAPGVPQLFNIGKAATTTAVISSVNPSDFGQSVRLFASVTSAAGIPTGTVQFKDGGANFGSAQGLNSGGVALLTTSSLSPGPHTITGDYSGDANFLISSGTLSGSQVVKAQPSLSINDVSIAEGNSGTTNLIFTVTLSAASNLTVNVNYATANGTATLADNDYQAASDTLTFNPGEVTKTITVLVNGDQKFEPDETVLMNLTSAVNATISDNQGVGTILNDDTLQLILDESGPDANQATAFDSLLFVRDPFHVQSIADWLDLGPDRNTRVIIFAANLQLNQGETASAVVLSLVDANNQTFDVPAEDVRPVPNFAFTQVRFRLPNTMAAGVCLVTIKAHGQISNTGTIRIMLP
jgi:hypothetical protein